MIDNEKKIVTEEKLIKESVEEVNFDDGDHLESVFDDSWEKQSKDNTVATKSQTGKSTAVGLADLTDSVIPNIEIPNFQDQQSAFAIEADEEVKPEAPSKVEAAVNAPIQTDSMVEQLTTSLNLMKTKTGILDQAGMHLENIRKELVEGGTFRGSRLTNIRNHLEGAMTLDPSLELTLRPLADHFNPISGRTQKIFEALRDPNTENREEATRKEIARLVETPNKTEGDISELRKLRRELFDRMNENYLKDKEVSALYEKDDAKTITEAESKRLQELESLRPGPRLAKDKEFMLQLLERESALLASAATKGGQSTQGIIFRTFKATISGNKDLQLIQLPGESAIDDAGADFILVNKKTGNFMFVDPTQKSADSDDKRVLPQIRKDGLICSDPRDERYLQFGPIGSSEYERARQRDIERQAENIVKHLETKGSPLNIADIYIPSAFERRQARQTDNADEKLSFKQKFEALPEQARLAEIRDYRANLLERKRGLEEMVTLSNEKSQQLKKEARECRRQDSTRADILERQAYLLENWSKHTEGATNQKKSPMTWINNRLKDLEVLETGISQKVKDQNPKSRETSTEAPKDSVDRVKKEAADLQRLTEVIRSGKGSHKQITDAMQRMSAIYGPETVEGKQLSTVKELLIETDASRSFAEKVPKALRDKPPTNFADDVKDALSETLEANKDSWGTDFTRKIEQLLKNYESKDAGAIERVNRMITDGQHLIKLEKSTQAAGPHVIGKETSTAGAGTERYATPHLSDEKAHIQSIETLTSPDGMKFIRAISMDSLTVSGIEEKFSKLDAEIEKAKANGQSRLVEELQELKLVYDSMPTKEGKTEFCKDLQIRLKQEYETAKGGEKGFSKNISGKAGTTVAAMIVAGWCLDMAAPQSFAESKRTRALPGKR